MPPFKFWLRRARRFYAVEIALRYALCSTYPAHHRIVSPLFCGSNPYPRGSLTYRAVFCFALLCFITILYFRRFVNSFFRGKLWGHLWNFDEMCSVSVGQGLPTRFACMDKFRQPIALCALGAGTNALAVVGCSTYLWRRYQIGEPSP